MADTIQPPGEPQLARPVKRAGIKSLLGPLFALRAADVQLYRICDDLSGMLIFPMLVFGPWAFGTTDPWSVWTMNIAGYALGILLLAKLFIRGSKGYTALRWENYSMHSATKTRHRHPLARLLARSLAGLTLAVLAYCLVSALNARATFNSDTRLFEYHRCLAWLPHSLDSHRTWFIFWTYLGLAASFWAVRDWLLGMTPAEERAVRNSDFAGHKPSFAILRPAAADALAALHQRRAAGRGVHCPARERLHQIVVHEATVGESGRRKSVWAVSLSFQCRPILQSALAGVPRFLVEPAIAIGDSSFAFVIRNSHHLLLLCAAIMAACPIISTSREGALVAAGMLVLAVIFLAVFGARGSAFRSPHSAYGMLGFFFVLTLALGWYFGWHSLAPRLEQIGEGYQYREAMYDAAKPMAADYPIYGTGPGTFGTVFQFFLVSPSTYWPEQLHNDWLETRITFGWAGMALLLAALACVGLRWFVPGGIRSGRRFVVLIWLALAGCLIEARFDFPFQIHSILFLFLVFCAALFSMSQRSGASRQ